jgi:hypothetical protein
LRRVEGSAGHEAAGLTRNFLHIDMFIEHDDVPGPQLNNQPLADRRQELQVKILPERFLLHIGVHARER